MKHLLILITLFILTTCSHKTLNKWEHIYMYVSSYEVPSTDDAIRISDLIYDFSDKYDLPYAEMMRLFGIESKYKQFAYNKKTGARGYGQVIDKWFRYGFWYIDDGKLGEYLNTKGYHTLKQVKKYYYRRGYAIELGFFAMSEWRKIKKGDLNLAVLGYGGGYSKGACTNHMSKYTNYILNGRK